MNIPIEIQIRKIKWKLFIKRANDQFELWQKLSREAIVNKQKIKWEMKGTPIASITIQSNKEEFSC
jgi:hypothetical protein